MANQAIRIDDIYQQLLSFGYSTNEINHAMNNVVNKLDINDIIEYIGNSQYAVCLYLYISYNLCIIITIMNSVQSAYTISTYLLDTNKQSMSSEQAKSLFTLPKSSDDKEMAV